MIIVEDYHGSKLDSSDLDQKESFQSQSNTTEILNA